MAETQCMAPDCPPIYLEQEELVKSPKKSFFLALFDGSWANDRERDNSLFPHMSFYAASLIPQKGGGELRLSTTQRTTSRSSNRVQIYGLSKTIIRLFFPFLRPAFEAQLCARIFLELAER
jgi:hypothetical protein